MDRLVKVYKTIQNDFINKIFQSGDRNIFFLFGTLGLIAFSHSFFYDYFVFDDAVFVTESPLLKNVGFISFFKAWADSRTPVVYNVWQIISLFFGTKSAFPFRLVSILFHIVNTFGLFVMARELVKRFNPGWMEHTQKITYSLVIACLFFLLHPMQSESVIWISSFKGTLASTFAIFSILFYLYSRDNEADTHTRYTFILLSFSAYILGLLCKPNIVTIPLIFIVLDILLFKLKGAKLAAYNFCYFVSIMLISLIHMINPAQSTGVIHQGMRDRLMLMLETFKFSVLKIIVPVNYSFDYQLSPEKLMEMFEGNLVAMGWSLVAFYLVLSFLLLFLWQKKRNLILCGFFLFFSFYLVNSGLVSFIFQNISTVANRYQYLPLMGFCLIIVGTVFYGLKKNEKVTKILSVLIIVLMGIRGVHEGVKWRTSYNLLNNSYLNHKDSYPLNIALGSIAYEKKDYKSAQRFFETAYKANDGEFYNESYTKLLEVYGINGELEKGAKLIKKALDVLSDKTGEVDTAILRFYFDSRQYLEVRDFMARAEHYTTKNPARAAEVKLMKEQVAKIFADTTQETIRQMGMQAFNKKQYKVALDYITAAYAMHPEEKLGKFKRYLEVLIEEERKGLPHNQANFNTTP